MFFKDNRTRTLKKKTNENHLVSRISKNSSPNSERNHHHRRRNNFFIFNGLHECADGKLQYREHYKVAVLFATMHSVCSVHAGFWREIVRLLANVTSRPFRQKRNVSYIVFYYTIGTMNNTFCKFYFTILPCLIDSSIVFKKSTILCIKIRQQYYFHKLINGLNIDYQPTICWILLC